MAAFSFLSLTPAAGQSSLPDTLPEKSSRTPAYSPLLQRQLGNIKDEELIPLEIMTTNSSHLMEYCRLSGIELMAERSIGTLNFLSVRLKSSLVKLLSAQPDILFMEYLREAKEELKQEGLDYSLNEVSFAHHIYPGINGSGINLSIKETAFDTADIDFRGRYFITPLTPPNVKLHATSMASISGGGGNSDPSAFGVGWDAQMTSSGYDVLLPDDDHYFESYGISVQNHSYGTGIENYYGLESMAYDESCTHLPEIVHIFSSGNDGNSSPSEGTYAGLTGWANITGQFKQSKNTITVGATDSLANVVDLSSRGPAYDGRIKPELVAFGQGGTSGAAALVSGLCLLMQDEYKTTNADAFPPASLLKAILVNTAKDVGRPGPDFETGFGSVRAYEALKAIEQNQIIIGQITQGDFYTVPIAIPEGIRQLKITMAWSDPAAQPEAANALVNDLDLELKIVNSGEVLLPWVLSTFPHHDSLSLPAQRGLDTKNNIEQITLEAPAPGLYEIIVKGKKITSGTQDFSMTWWTSASNDFQWKFPSASDFLIPGKKNLLRWSGGGDLKGTVAYKNIGQDTWQTVADNIDASGGSAFWNTPGQSGLVQLRWTNADTFILSDTFVLGDPVRPKVGFVCPDSLLFYWNPAQNVDSFEILALGEEHLEHLGYTTDTFYISHQPDGHGFVYAVAPVYAGVNGPRSYGFDYRTQGAGCYINNFFLRYIQEGSAFFEANLGTLYNVDSVILLKLDVDIFNRILSISPVTDTKLQFETNDLSPGVNHFHLVVALKNGKGVTSEDVVVYYTADQEILIFPNPASTGYDMQVLVKRNESYTLKIIDLAGREVINIAAPTNPQAIDVSGLAAGEYIVVIQFESGDMQAQPFVIRD